MRRHILAAVLGALIAAPAAQAQEVNFGIISTETTANLRSVWDPFLADMNRKTGLQVKGFFASDYAGVIEAMRFRKVHLAWYGNKSAMEAVDRADGEIFAQSVDVDGNPGYWSHLIVHKDSPIKTLDDVLKCDKTLDFGIGDPNSTSGFLVPMTFIFSAKSIDPRTCFKTVRSANHEANALAVANRLVSVAANNSESMARLKVTSPAKAGDIRIIWTSPLIASDPLVWRKDLDPAVKAKISEFIFSYGVSDPAEKAILAGLKWAPFRKSDNRQLLPIRQMEVSRLLMRAKADTTLEPAKREAEVARLQKEFDDLGRQIGPMSN